METSRLPHQQSLQHGLLGPCAARSVHLLIQFSYKCYRTEMVLVVAGGLTNNDAQERLKGTLAGDKNEILYSQFDINYNNEPAQFKKGTTIIKKKVEVPCENGSYAKKLRTKIVQLDCDIIGDDFWNENQHLLQPFTEN